MASSNEDDEFLPDSVTNYELVDGRDQIVSFSCIPLCWTGDALDLDVSVEMNARFYLDGTTSDGLERTYKQVLAWKYNISSAQPEVSVLCKDKYWIKLLKPRKRFEVISMSTLVTLHFLHFVKHNPEAPAQCIWNNLARAFSSSVVQPCKQDILDHIGLVKDAFESDIELPQSEYMCAILGVQPKKKKLFGSTMDEQPVKKPSFVVDEAEHIESLNLLQEEMPEKEEEPEEEEEDHNSLNLSKVKKDLKEAENLDVPDVLKETENLVDGKDDDAEGKEHEHNEEEELEDDEELQLLGSCVIGDIRDIDGDVLCCEGPCMRSFHPTIASGEYNCGSLGLSQAQVDAMPVFFCNDCKYKQHQCLACGKLGSSGSDSGAEVFSCVSATRGHFQSVAKVLYPENATQAKKIEAEVTTCPVHKCLVYGQSEDRNIHVPRGISFETDSERNVPQRARDDDLLPKLDKLQEIVDMLQWYAEDGDMIVDFSCGSNDFSCLMSKKLESVGKKCSFKNYAICQAKNDFNFEEDWFSVPFEALPIGSRLIIGLNPPFGVKATLANQFIDKALQFKPKLMILIVPKGTQRLDQKPYPYKLIWEDVHLLAGKSLNFPGSVDVHNKQLEQSNLVSPSLSLWSRPDCIQKHKEIAMMRNHLPKETLKQMLSPPDKELYGTTNLAFIKGESVFTIVDSRSTMIVEDNDPVVGEDDPVFTCDDNHKYLNLPGVLANIVGTKAGNVWAAKKTETAIYNYVMENGSLFFEDLGQFNYNFLHARSQDPEVDAKTKVKFTKTSTILATVDEKGPRMFFIKATNNGPEKANEYATSGSGGDFAASAFKSKINWHELSDQACITWAQIAMAYAIYNDPYSGGLTKAYHIKKDSMVPINKDPLKIILDNYAEFIKVENKLYIRENEDHPKNYENATIFLIHRSYLSLSLTFEDMTSVIRSITGCKIRTRCPWGAIGDTDMDISLIIFDGDSSTACMTANTLLEIANQERAKYMDDRHSRGKRDQRPKHHYNLAWVLDDRCGEFLFLGRGTDKKLRKKLLKDVK